MAPRQLPSDDGRTAPARVAVNLVVAGQNGGSMTVDRLATSAVIDEAATARLRVAARIAAEVRHGESSGETRIAKVSSLVNAFRLPGRPAKVVEVTAALEDQGLLVDSDWAQTRRTGVVRLAATDSARDRLPPGSDPTIQLSVWSPERVSDDELALPPFAAPAPDDVLWFNVDPPVPPPPAPPGHPDSVPDYIESRVQEVAERLGPWCPGLDEEMVRDLMMQDVQPKVETYSDRKDGLRGVSVVGVIARENPGDDHDSDGVSEQLVFQMVEIIVGDHWIITCWHPSRLFVGSTEAPMSYPILREPFLGHVRHRWLREQPAGATARVKTSGDLGMYLARSLVDTYDASHRMMERWVSSWEVAFYKSLSSKEKAAALKEAAGEISNLLSMVGEFRRRLTAFEHARWSTTDKSWFPNLTDRDEDAATESEESTQVVALANTIGAAETNFNLLAENIRADINLLMLQSTATQQESTERLQGYLGKVTGLVLVPTLVAGLFGANTELPGGGHWLGFELMVVLMIVSAVVVYLAIRRIGR